MRITTIIVTRNRSQKLVRTIKSLLKNTKIPNEILIIDNNSTDDTKKQVTYLAKINKQIRYVNEKQIGISYARNRGLKEAKYELISFTDDDCMVDLKWIENIIKSHIENKNVAAIGGKTLNINNNEIGYCGHLYRTFLTLENIMFDKINYKNSKKTLNKKHYMKYLATQNISYKKNKINGLYFNPKLDPDESVDFSWRIIKKNKHNIIYDPHIVVYHEYLDTLKQFIKRNKEYAQKSKPLIKIAKQQKYFIPNKVSPLRREFHYIIFIFFELIKINTQKYSKVKILLFMILREIIFGINFLF